jgi:Tol biopolymer transport system component
MKRATLLTSLLVLFWFAAGAQEIVRLEYISTAHQAGPVGYRDPLGVISPDGQWLATIVNRHLYLQRVKGGLRIELMPSDRLKSWIAWLPDSSQLVVHERSLPGTNQWFLVDIKSGQRRPLWTAGQILTSSSLRTSADSLSQLAWSADGKRIAGIVSRTDGSRELWTTTADGRSSQALVSKMEISFPVWLPDREQVACLQGKEGRFQIVSPCGEPTAQVLSDRNAYGPFAFSPNGKRLYFAALNEQGTLDLWSRRLPDGPAQQLTHFSRDTYSPTVSSAGGLLFKTQIFNTQIATMKSMGGAIRVLTDFQSETPSWHPTGQQIGMTYGNFRRVIDDAKYPDIAQEIGIISLNESTPALAPITFHASASEDQGMCWSPNGKWIVFHSHQQGSDDLWLQVADRSKPPVRISNGGYETGWPRWSPNGRWIAYDSFPSEESRQSLLYIIEVDQTNGTTKPPQQVQLEQFDESVNAPQWMPDSESMILEGSGKIAGHKNLYQISRRGGQARKIHEFLSDQIVSGIAVSPDGKWVAYIGQSQDESFQIYRFPITGGKPEQLSFDPPNKTQPAYSPDGEQLTFTIWTYSSQFWILFPQTP